MSAPDLSPAGALAQEGDEARFLAALFAKPEAREQLFALIAFNVELAKIPASVSEPMLGQIRLAWWREAVDELFAGAGPRGHVVMHALAAAHEAAPLHRPSLEALIEARDWALEPEGGSDPEALRRFLAGTGGALAEASVRALGGGDEAGAVAMLAGKAEGAGRLIRALPFMLAQGGFTPFSDGLDQNALREGRAPEALTGAIADLAAEALSWLAEARSRRAAIPRALRAPLLSVHAAEASLREAAAPGFDPFAQSAPSPFRARAELLIRAAFGRF